MGMYNKALRNEHKYFLEANLDWHFTDIEAAKWEQTNLRNIFDLVATVAFCLDNYIDIDSIRQAAKDTLLFGDWQAFEILKEKLYEYSL